MEERFVCIVVTYYLTEPILALQTILKNGQMFRRCKF